MSLLLRRAQTRTPAFSGKLPGSDRDLEASPLSGEEREIIEHINTLVPSAQKKLDRHGLAFDRALYEAWQAFDAAERDVRDGKAQSHAVPKPEKMAYRGNWYECTDCKVRDSKKCVCLEWGNGPGVMIGQEITFEFPVYNQFRKKDDWRKVTLVIYCGWLCPKCLAKRAIAARAPKKLEQLVEVLERDSA